MNLSILKAKLKNKLFSIPSHDRNTDLRWKTDGCGGARRKEDNGEGGSWVVTREGDPRTQSLHRFNLLLLSNLGFHTRSYL